MRKSQIVTRRFFVYHYARMTARLMFLWLMCLLVACESAPVAKRVRVEVDGKQLELQTQAATVYDALLETDIELGPLDRVSPDLVMPIERTTSIVITRVREEFVRERHALPFPRQLLHDDAFDEGVSRVLQLGVNGQEELTYRVRFENDQQVARELVRRQLLEIPREEIVVIGAKGRLQDVPFAGTIIYISNGNGWLMRDSSAAKRPLTFSGDLDGRVFAVSPNNDRVLISRRASVGGDVGAVGPLNSLWLVDTRTVGESPTNLSIEDVLYADWLDAARIIYSTAERTVGAPGWKAHNDLWLFNLETHQKQQLISSISPVAYAFWGLSFSLSPNGKRIGYASADQLGFIELPSGQRTALQPFPVYHTQSGWVWTPDLSWSGDSRLIAGTLHAPAPDTPDPERAPTFDVWAIDASGSFAAPIAPATGMFASPSWSRQGRIAYAQAHQPYQSAESQYDVYVMDADGSNKLRVFPQQGERGITNPQFAWSNDGSQLIVVQDGNLFLVNVDGHGAVQLTADGGGSHPRWR